MTHYSNNPGHVRIDQFKPSGKWYQTVQGDMSNFYGLPDDPQHVSYLLTDWAVALVIAQQFPSMWKDSHDTDYDWWFLVLDPYHRHGHPFMMSVTQVKMSLSDYRKHCAKYGKEMLK